MTAPVVELAIGEHFAVGARGQVYRVSHIRADGSVEATDVQFSSVRTFYDPVIARKEGVDSYFTIVRRLP